MRDDVPPRRLLVRSTLPLRLVLCWTYCRSCLMLMCVCVYLCGAQSVLSVEMRRVPAVNGVVTRDAVASSCGARSPLPADPDRSAVPKPRLRACWSELYPREGKRFAAKRNRGDTDASAGQGGRGGAPARFGSRLWRYAEGAAAEGGQGSPLVLKLQCTKAAGSACRSSRSSRRRRRFEGN